MYFDIQVVRDVLQIHRSIVTCKRCIVVCKQYLGMYFINVVAMSFHNISNNLDFKPDDNCSSPFGQTEADRPASTLLLS
jgi:hypothetical protein